MLGVLRPALEKVSVDVQVCAESRSGNDLLAKRKFDAVIIDCDDLENGFDLLKGLRQTQSNAKSVAFAVVNGKTTTQEAFSPAPISCCRSRSTPLHASRCFNAALNFMVRERRRYFRHPVDMPLRIVLAPRQRAGSHDDQPERGRHGHPRSRQAAQGCAAAVLLHASRHRYFARTERPDRVGDGTGHAGIRFLEVPQSSQYQLEKWLTDRLQKEIPKRIQGYAALR